MLVFQQDSAPPHCARKTNELSHQETWLHLAGSVTAWGYWRQRADERLGDPPPKVDLGAFGGQRQGWKTPRGLSGSALLLCV